MGNYEYWNYIDLSITSSKLPRNPHLFIELDNGYLILVDSTSFADILISTDKGENWDIFQTGDFTDGKITVAAEVYSAFFDRDNDLIYFGFGGITGEVAPRVSYLDLSDYSFTPIAVDIGAMNYRLCDVWIRDGNLEVVTRYVGNTEIRVWRWVDPNWIEIDRQTVDYAYSYGFATIFGTVARWIGSSITDEDIMKFWRFDGTDITGGGVTDVHYDIPKECAALAFDGDNTAFFVIKRNNDSKYILWSVDVTTNEFTKKGEMPISFMLDRNVDSMADPHNNSEKAFHISDDKIYQLPLIYKGYLNLISIFDFTDTIKAMTTHFVMDNGGKMYEYKDVSDYIIVGKIYNNKEDYPSMILKTNRDYIQLAENLFIQIIGTYSANGSATANSVVFEGRTQNYSGGRLQSVDVLGFGVEMDEVKPSGSKSGRTDQIISDINDDTSNNPNYIHDGTLSVGEAMGTIVFVGDKKYRKILNHFRDIDGFTWYLKPQGALDYNIGTTDSGADLKYEEGVDTDKIYGVRTSKHIIKANRVTVRGGIDSSDGTRYEGIYNNLEDQQENGIKQILVVDASLNSDALCVTAATAIGTREETSQTTVEFGFQKPSIGLVQVGQQISFKFISGDESIALAQFTVDRIEVDIKSEYNYIQISSGLIIRHEEYERELPEENSQRIDQNAEAICHIKTGTYTGNDAQNREITGLGFVPKALFISRGDWGGFWYIDDNMIEWWSVRFDTWCDDSIKFITDGFELNDGGGYANINTAPRRYTYSAWG